MTADKFDAEAKRDAVAAQQLARAGQHLPGRER
jgi:hypothetical protein